MEPVIFTYLLIFLIFLLGKKKTQHFFRGDVLPSQWMSLALQSPRPFLLPLTFFWGHSGLFFGLLNCPMCLWSIRLACLAVGQISVCPERTAQTQPVPSRSHCLSPVMLISILRSCLNRDHCCPLYCQAPILGMALDSWLPWLPHPEDSDSSYMSDLPTFRLSAAMGVFKATIISVPSGL